MMRNRAGLLAILVLVIASLIMIFFVMPQLGMSKKPVTDAINQAGAAVKNIIADTQNAGDTAQDAAKTAQTNLTNAADTATKLGGLASTAVKSLDQLKSLFADGKGPAADVLNDAKSKTESSLQAIVDFTAPQGADNATAALVGKAHDGAGKALAIIKALPDTVADALNAIAKAEADLLGQPEPQAQTNAGPVKPSFAVLRVEPDGSTVIAGSAEPNSKLQIMDGDKVVTTTDVGPSGDFAAVLDNPLPAGDHELVLKATGKDGNAQTSEEVATVSVPKDGSTQLLAMVSKPGTASRIITAPTAKQSRVASDATQQPAANGNAGDNQAGDNQAATTMASASPATNPAPATPEAAATQDNPDVVVNAVEIENDKIFVAGTTRPRAKVRAYADDKLIGEAQAGVDGHFVIDGNMPLSVGDHKIRADVVDGSGKVLVRVTVNFNRPAGNQVTVAAQTPPAAGSQTAANSAMVPLDDGELGKLKGDTGKAFGLLKKLYADGKTPGAEELAAARSSTEIALKSLADFRPGADASTALRDAAALVSASAAKALVYLHALPNDPKSVGDALARLDQMIADITKPVANVPAQSAQVQTASNGGDEPKSYQQQPLSESKSAVIIRRGDTLWQISRRTYGAGVRYTTIYLANEDKINNPDRILPGQVFGLPKDALPNSEELHRKRLSGQHLQ